jgi:hypothetical protein
MEHQCLGEECRTVLMIPCPSQQKQRAEIERLRAQMTRLGDLDTDTLNDLADENEHLKGNVSFWKSRYNGLKEEMERLREEIKRLTPQPSDGPTHTTTCECQLCLGAYGPVETREG